MAIGKASHRKVKFVAAIFTFNCFGAAAQKKTNKWKEKFFSLGFAVILEQQQASKHLNVTACEEEEMESTTSKVFAL